MIKWVFSEKTTNSEGTTITYRDVKNPWLVVQSRKRHIPHASGIGTWDHTTYFVIANGVQSKEFYRLGDAKEYAEEVYG